jgi:hypothetical protein
MRRLMATGKHFLDQASVSLGDNMALELEGICHLIADLKGFRQKPERRDALKGFEAG